MNEQKKIAERIKQLCQEKQFSYYLLAYKAAVPITTLMNILHSNTKNPGVLTLAKICDGLGITIQDFFDAEMFKDIENETE